MYRAFLRDSIDTPWTRMGPIRVGRVPTGAGTPDAFITVERDGLPHTRIDVYVEHGGPFRELIVWADFVVLGWGDGVHLVDPAARVVRRISCDRYFGHLYACDTHLLIASASEVICVDRRGSSTGAEATSASTA